MECLNYALAKVIVFKTDMVSQNLVLGFGEKKSYFLFSRAFDQSGLNL